MRKNSGYLLIAILLSCTPKDSKKNMAASYFDLVTYFKNESARLNAAHTKVDKLVAINGKAERKTIVVKDFNSEFEPFIAADINKASWRGLFTLNKKPGLIAYKSSSEKIPVKELLVTYRNNKVIALKIVIVNSNMLYTSVDSLSYFPDSLYEIKKTQKIKLLDKKDYLVKGWLK